jgi:hypothetical protein
LNCEEKIEGRRTRLERLGTIGGDYKKIQKEDESEEDQFYFSLPTETSFITIEETQYYKVMKKYEGMDHYDLNPIYEKVKNNLLDIFKH